MMSSAKKKPPKPAKAPRQRNRDFSLPWNRWDIILSTLGLNLLALALPILILQFVDRIIPHQAYDLLILFSLGGAIVIFAEAILKHARARIISWLGLNFSYKTSVRSYLHTLLTPRNLSAKTTVGEQMENLEAASNLREFMAGPGFLSFLDLPFVFLSLGIIAFLSPTLVLVPLGILTLLIALGFHHARKLTKALDQRQDVDNKRYNFMAQNLSNYHTLKSMAMESLMLRRYERLQYQKAYLENQVNSTLNHSRDSVSILSFTLFLGIICVGSLEVIKGNLSLGALSACVLLANLAVQPLENFMGTWLRLSHYRRAEKKLKTLLSQKIETPRDHQSTEPMLGRILLKNISFSYDSDSATILKDVTLDIKPKTTISISGPNGSGKTTLARLIVGDLLPMGGSIKYDEFLHEDIDPEIFRQQVMYVPVTCDLFSGTIMENLTSFRSDGITEEAIKFAVRLGLDEWVGQQPLGYNTLVGDALQKDTPQGIRQRIAIVRALVNQPKILILDEANAFLDDDGDGHLKNLLMDLKKEMTIILITHRTAYREIADECYDLVNGRLVVRMESTKIATEETWTRIKDTSMEAPVDRI